MLKRVLLGVAVLATLMAVPLDAYAQRGWGGGGYGGGRGGSGISIGSNGFSIGTGSGRISVGDGGYGYGRGYGYGNSGYGYGRNYSGYRGYNNGYNNGYYNDGYYGGGNYNNGYYTQPSTQYYSQPVVVPEQPYEGSGVAIRNDSDQTLSFVLDDSRQMQIEPGATQQLMNKGKFVVAFDRGSGKGQARYSIHEGLYAFAPTDNGWELFRQKDRDFAAQPNPEPNVRTAERPRLDDRELEPMTERSIDPNLRPSDDAALPPPLPENE